MKNRKWVMMLGLAWAAQAAEVVIQSFDTGGTLTFNELSSATNYRVEWASSPGGDWTNFAAASTRLDSIPHTGSGIVTASVPLWFRVTATVTNPAGMVLIPAGSFAMGNATNVFPADEGNADELPQHSVYVSAFFMDKYEVAKALWDNVKNYNGGNDYAYSNPGLGKATNHPVHTVNWFDVLKWCNARSEKDGVEPVYFADAAFTTLYKTGEVAAFANWSANGYRLPTEAEWEKAARGGVPDTRFPWTDYTNRISHAKANYYGLLSLSYDLSVNYHPTYATGSHPYSSPVGSFAPNGYGLYDMAGNMREWCWDWYNSGYYTNSPAVDPHGPTSGVTRMARGATYISGADRARCSDRWDDELPAYEINNIGFRCARGL